jgi:hypothetical protein
VRDGESLVACELAVFFEQGAFGGDESGCRHAGIVMGRGPGGACRAVRICPGHR